MKTKRTNNFTIMILLVIASMLFGFVPAGYAQDIQDWSDPKNLSTSGSASNPSMVIDSDGTLHVIWLDQIGGYKYVQSTDGLTWITPVTVKFPFSTEGAPPVLFSDPQGIIHMFWLNDTNKLVYAQTINGNFAAPPAWRRLVEIDSTVYAFDASLDAQGRMHVAYLKNPGLAAGAAGVFYRRSSDGGVTWAPSVLLYESPYFRSLTSENAHVRMAVSDNPEQDAIYIVWDDRSQKRIFIANSGNGGLNWDAVKEMVAPQENLGNRTPYNADIDVLEDQILATWLVGEPETGICTPFSWFSSDGGETWGEQLPILSEAAPCPERSEFISIDPEYSASLFTLQGDLSLSVWNGTGWSNPQIQTGLSSITNPATFDPIMLGCEQAAAYKGRLFVVGCDQGAGGDIWLVSRPLDSLDDLFPLPSQWRGDADVITVPRRLESLTSVSDSAGNVHSVWIQSSYSATDPFVPRIEYSRWDGANWSVPSPIITNTVESSQRVALNIDSQQRLLLSWVNPHTDELLFTWANSERANTPVEWAAPVILSASSTQVSSPTMLVDATDRIVIAFAVTLNEERGIYVTQSVDSGETWSAPVNVFDAVSEGWEMVDRPRLALTTDGALHVLFTRYALIGSPQPVGLYYSRSEDGGTTWLAPEAVSEQPAHWSEMVAYQGILHRLWQDTNHLAASTNHQISLDGGVTWTSPVGIPGDADISSSPSVTMDPAGGIHFLQVIKQDVYVFQEWEWSDERWHLVESRKVSTQDLNSPAVVEGGITSDGVIYSLLQFEGQLTNGIETDLMSMSRSLELNGEEQPGLAVISTPSVSSTPTMGPDALTTPATLSPIAGLSNPQPRINRNMVGFVLIVIVVLFILVVTVPRRSKATDKTSQPK